MLIRAVGIDAAFANMGFAQVSIDRRGLVTCTGLKLISTEGKSDGKGVRKSSTELRRARELVEAVNAECAGNMIAFVEVPSGSQSAAVARSLGIVVGVLASCPIPIIEVSPLEVKRAVNPGRKAKVSKDDIIKWAAKRWPNADWILHERSGKTWKKGDLQNCNEHLADALATIAAGIATPEFQRLIALMPNHAIPDTPDQRSSSGGPRRRRVSLDPF